MITYYKHKDIDKIKWDRCVNADPHAAVFFYSWFLDVAAPQWDGLVGDNYEAVFPLPTKTKFGIPYLFQPFFTRSLAICARDEKWKGLKEFLYHIPDRFRLQEFCIEPTDPNKVEIANLSEKKYQSLKLEVPFEILHKSFSANIIQNLKKAVKNNLLINPDVSALEIVSDFKKHKGKDLTKFSPQEYTLLKDLMDACLIHQAGYTRSVQNASGERLASAFFMYSHNRIIYLKGSTSETGKKTGAMHYLMSSMIQEFSEQNLIFDFGGSSVPSLARFFKGFGGVDHTYYLYTRNTLPKPIKWFKKDKIKK